jgi:hypothetical protein
MTQFGPEQSEQLPASKTGGLYKCHRHEWLRNGLSVPCFSGRRGHPFFRTKPWRVAIHTRSLQSQSDAHVKPVRCPEKGGDSRAVALALALARRRLGARREIESKRAIIYFYFAVASSVATASRTICCTCSAHLASSMGAAAAARNRAAASSL